jgi:NDP-sugar pyrophosphorylase family protein
MIQHIIEMAASEGFSDIVISTHHKAEIIEEFCGDGGRFGVGIRYIREGKPLGTGGSFGLLSDVSGSVVVTNADIMTTIGYRQMLDYHLEQKAVATVAVREHHIPNPFGVVLSDGVMFTGFEEKPIWRCNINAGIYVLSSSLRKFILPNEHTDMPDVIDRARKAGEVVTIYPLHENWSDLGSEAEYLKHK